MHQYTEIIRLAEWTNGAQRAWQRASGVATHLGSDEIRLPHMFWSLLVDEGRAGTHLESAGLSMADLDQIDQTLASVSLQDVEDLIRAGTENQPTFADECLNLARESLHFALQLDRQGETSTEHILLALKNGTAPWCDLLAKCFAESPTTSDAEIPVHPPAATIPRDYQIQLREREPLNRADLLRIIDAAANRCREALRVIEDFARFSWGHRFLSQNLKQLRHDLQQTLAFFSPEELAVSRNTMGDVGVSIETSTEYQRQDTYDVLIAAFKRTQEALRTLEEYTKIISGGVAHHFESLRYRSYVLEKAVLQTLQSREVLASQQLYVLLTDSQCPAGVGHVIRGALAAGVRMFQVREKSLPDRALVAHCRQLRRWTRDEGALLIINDRPDIAALVEADGVHLGQEELSVADARRIVGPACLIGVSTHSIEQARQAVLEGADYLGVGPMFPSSTKTFASFPGPAFAEQVAQEIELPWFAIGGITPQNLRHLIEVGTRRVAVSSVISQSEAPVEICTELLWQLRDATLADNPS